MNTFVIHFIANDQKGIIAQITTILYKADINILSIEQHVDKKIKKFYIRILADLSSTNINMNQLKDNFDTLNQTLKGKFNFYNPNKKCIPRVCLSFEIFDILELKYLGYVFEILQHYTLT